MWYNMPKSEAFIMKYTALDYLKWRGDLSFEESPVNDVDEMLFSCIGKPNYGHIFSENGGTMKLKDAVERFLYLHKGQRRIGVLAPPQLMELLKLMAESRRYGELLLTDFVNIVRTDEIEQFSALTVYVPGDRIYVTFRGTDDTLLGWKENCDLVICDSIPSQRSALAYLEQQAEKYSGEIVVAGHSKGGNLAVYSACNASGTVRERIVKVISYDGPGFLPDFFTDSAYSEMRDRIFTYFPYRSIVGMVLNEAGNTIVLSCDEYGVNTHNPLLWHVEKSGFVVLPELSRFSTVFRASLAATFDRMDVEERRELIKEIFDVMYSTGAFQLTDFSYNTVSQMLEMAGHFRKAPVLRSFLYTLSELYLKGTVRGQSDEKEVKENDTVSM